MIDKDRDRVTQRSGVRPSISVRAREWGASVRVRGRHPGHYVDGWRAEMIQDGRVQQQRGDGFNTLRVLQRTNVQRLEVGDIADQLQHERGGGHIVTCNQDIDGERTLELAS